MTTTRKTFHIVITGPLGAGIATYDRSRPPRHQINSTASDQCTDQTFIDAMTVREEVFVDEQGVKLENELDNDDAACIHLVLYSSRNAVDGDASHGQASGTIRIVPQNASLHLEFEQHRHLDGSKYQGSVRSSTYNGEPCIKFGRLAVVMSERGHGYAGTLVRAALDYATTHPAKLTPDAQDSSVNTEWTGLVLIHAQRQVQKFWERFGFTLDEGLGMWNEEGIDHVAISDFNAKAYTELFIPAPIVSLRLEHVDELFRDGLQVTETSVLTSTREVYE